MRRVNFDYANTCPTIDKAINQAKGEIQNFIDDLISDMCPYIPMLTRKELALDNANKLYEYIEDAFETARSSNEKMRDEADSQIASLKDEIDDLTSQVKSLEDMVE